MIDVKVQSDGETYKNAPTPKQYLEITTRLLDTFQTLRQLTQTSEEHQKELRDHIASLHDVFIPDLVDAQGNSPADPAKSMETYYLAKGILERVAAYLQKYYPDIKQP